MAEGGWTLGRSSVRAMLLLGVSTAVFLVAAPFAWAGHTDDASSPDASHHSRSAQQASGKPNDKAHKPYSGQTHAKIPKAHRGHGKRRSPLPPPGRPRPVTHSVPAQRTSENGWSGVPMTVQRADFSAPRTAAVPLVSSGLAARPRQAPVHPLQPIAGRSNLAAEVGSVVLAGSANLLGLDASIAVTGMAMVVLAIFLVTRRGRFQLAWLTSRSSRRR